MTIPATASEIGYAGNGVTTAFSIPFAFDTSSDIKVVRQNADGSLTTLVSGFVISGGDGSVGTLTFTVAPISGVTIWIFDDPAATQSTDYVDNDGFPAESHERALDRAVRLVKRGGQRINRAIRYPDGESNTDGELADVDSRKGKYLFFDAVTGAISYAVNLALTTLTQSVIGALLYPRTAAEISASVTPVNYFHPEGHVDRYGNNTTPGTTDMTTALVNWAKCASPGLRMELAGGGTYVFDPSVVVNGVLFSGAAGFSVYGNGATIIAKSGASVVAQHEMMRFNNCQDFYVENLIVDANRSARTPVESTTHNINIADNCARGMFHKVRAINGVTDGFYIGSDNGATGSSYPADITLSECIGDNCYRNNLSIVASLRCTVRGGSYRNANGTAPEGGIDAEPDVTITSGNRDLVIDGVDVSGNVGYGLSLAGPGGSAMNTRVSVTNLRGNSNTAGLFLIGNVNGLGVNGVECGPHSAATRGVIDIGTGSITDATFKNVNFRGVTISSTSKWLFYIQGANGRVLIDGFRAYDCINLPALQCSAETTLINIELERSFDVGIQLSADNCVLRNLVCRNATGRVVFVSGDSFIGENLTFIDCLVASSNAMTVAAGATGSIVRDVVVLQTSSIPASAVGLFYAEVPLVLQNVLCRSAGTDFTPANAVNLSAGNAGAFIDGMTPGGQYFLSGTLTPAQITSNQNDYNPTGLGGATILRLQTDASRNVTGLAGGSDGRMIYIFNIGSTDLVFTDNDAASSANNRFLLNGNTTVNTNEGIAFRYDGGSSKWRSFGRSV